jgi:hypothetical protein
VRFSYVYFMKADAAAVRATAPTHAAYWRSLGLDGYQGGPFADRSGGLITFVHSSEPEVERLVEGAPFRRAGLIDAYWLKVWAPE